jgi:hypothetical protein
MKKQYNLPESKEGRIYHDVKANHNIDSRVLPIQLNLFDMDYSEDILFDKVWLKCLPIVQAYRDILSLNSLDDHHSDLLEKILALSEVHPLLSKLLSMVDETISLDDGLSSNFARRAKLKIGDEEYQAWKERLIF